MTVQHGNYVGIRTIYHCVLLTTVSV